MDGMTNGRAIGGIVSGGEGQMNEIGYPLSDYVPFKYLESEIFGICSIWFDKLSTLGKVPREKPLVPGPLKDPSVFEAR
jgi:hypothetical protein